jgi:hypothetical protein
MIFMEARRKRGRAAVEAAHPEEGLTNYSNANQGSGA